MRALLTIGMVAVCMQTASAEWSALAHRINQMNRYWGEGWSDGYHSCRYDARGLGADLPPAPQWLRARWMHSAHRPAEPHWASPPMHVDRSSGSTPWQPPYMPSPSAPQPATVPPSILEEIRQFGGDEDSDALPTPLDDAASDPAAVESEPEELKDADELDPPDNAGDVTSEREVPPPAASEGRTSPLPAVDRQAVPRVRITGTIHPTISRRSLGQRE